MKPKSTPKTTEKSNRDPLKEITEKIISSATEVYSQLGPGLLESVYDEALAHEFTLRRIRFERQKEIRLTYKGKDVGWYRVDHLVEDEVLVELKTVETLQEIHETQLLTYLRALNKKVGLLINFNVVRFPEGIKRLTL
jgi:GxxExxY protein